MKKKAKTFVFTSQKWGNDRDVVLCPEYDGYRDFHRDPSGYYVLIRLEWDIRRIALAICDKDHQILRVFKGRSAQDIYNAVFNEQKKNKLEWFKEPTHIAYLGKELKKAELCLALGANSYFQE